LIGHWAEEFASHWPLECGLLGLLAGGGGLGHGGLPVVQVQLDVE
jgi:hypothetical protein